QELLINPAAEPVSDDPVRQGCQAAAPLAEPVDPSEKRVSPGNAVGPKRLMQKLGLKPGHVHIGRALGLARLALQTEAEDFVERGVGQALEIRLARDRESERVRSAARAIALIPSRLVRRAHRAFGLFSADADTRTEFGRAEHPAIGGE